MVAIGPVVSEEKSFEIVDGRRTDDGRTTEPAYTISSPGAFGSGELKTSESSVVTLFTAQKEITSQTDEYFVISSSKTYVFEDNLTKY